MKTAFRLTIAAFGLAHCNISAFSGCTKPTDITIPNSVTNIEQFAFVECTGLISVTIPNSVTRIKPGTFARCTNLTSGRIPNSVLLNERMGNAQATPRATASCGPVDRPCLVNLERDGTRGA